MTLAQFTQFSSGVVTAAGSEMINLSGDGNFSTLSNIESYSVGDATTNARTITITQAGHNVTANSATDAITFDIGAQALTGTLTGEASENDFLSMSNGANISGATINNIANLTISNGATITMSTTQFNGFSGTITAAGSETLTLSSTGTVTADLSTIETIATASGGSETITLSAAAANNKTLTAADVGNDGFVITASAGVQTINGSAGADNISGGDGDDVILPGAGTDSMTGGNNNDSYKGSNTDLNGDTVTDLGVGDKIILTGINGLTTANVRINTGGGHLLEIDTDATNFTAVEVSITLSNNPGNDIDIDQVNDSGADTEIIIKAANAVPVFSNLNGGSTFTENGSAVVIDANVTVSDTELDALNAANGDYNGASLTIARNGGASTQDVYANSGLLSTLTQAGNLVYNGTTVGVVTTNSNGTLLLSFNANATTAIVNAVMQSITYSNHSESPPGSVTLDWTFNDGSANSSGINQASITITSVNDAPVLSDQSPTLTAINEDAGDDDGSGADGDDDGSDNTNNQGSTVAAIVVDGSVTDADGGAVEAIAVTDIDNTNGVWQYSTDNGISWNNFSGTTGSSVDIETSARLLDGSLVGGSTQKIRFVPDANYNGSATITFRAWDKSSGAAGGIADASTNGTTTAFSSANDAASITINSVNDAPLFTNLNTDNPVVVAGGSAILIDVSTNSTVTNVDASDYNGGFLTIVQNTGTANGAFSFDGTTVTVGGDAAITAGETVQVSGNTVGTVHAADDGQGGNNLQITFSTAFSTNTNLQSLIRNMYYTAPSGLGDRTFTITLNDGDGTANGR